MAENRQEKLDRTGRRLLHAATADEETVNRASSAPFLYAKICARVAEERAKSAQSPYRLPLAMVARQAIPALALIAVIVVGAYFFADRNTPPPSTVNEAGLSRLEQHTPPTACNIANRSECVVSTDDVVAILVHAGEAKNP